MGKYNSATKVEIPFDGIHLSPPVIEDNEVALVLFQGIYKFVEKRHPSKRWFSMSVNRFEEAIIYTPEQDAKYDEYLKKMENEASSKERKKERLFNVISNIGFTWAITILLLMFEMIILGDYRPFIIILIMITLVVQAAIFIIEMMIKSKKSSSI